MTVHTLIHAAGTILLLAMTSLAGWSLAQSIDRLIRWWIAVKSNRPLSLAPYRIDEEDDVHQVLSARVREEVE